MRARVRENAIQQILKGPPPHNSTKQTKIEGHLTRRNPPIIDFPLYILFLYFSPLRSWNNEGDFVNPTRSGASLRGRGGPPEGDKRPSQPPSQDKDYIVLKLIEITDFDKEVLEELEKYPSKIAASIEKHRYKEALSHLMKLSALGNKTDNTFFLSIAPSAGPEPDKRPSPLFVVADEEPLGLNLNR